MTWRERLSSVDAAMQAPADVPGRAWPPGREILYVIDGPGSAAAGGVLLSTVYRELRKDGSWTRPKPASVDGQRAQVLPDPADRRIFGLLQGAASPYGSPSAYFPYATGAGRYVLSPGTLDTLVPLVCATGRGRVQTAPHQEDWPVLRWEDAEPWVFWIDVADVPGAAPYVLTGSLRRGDDRMDLSEPVLVAAGGIVLVGDQAARLDDGGAFPWIAHLRQLGPIRVPRRQGGELLGRLVQLSHVQRIELPEALRFDEVAVAPAGAPGHPPRAARMGSDAAPGRAVLRVRGVDRRRIAARVGRAR